MTGPQLEALVLAEIRRARLNLCFEIKRNTIGLFVLLWSDLAWLEGIGGRRFLARDPDVRHREASIAVLPLHSRVPRISWQGEDGGTTDLWLPPRAREAVIAALLAHALAQVAPTPRRLREARLRLRDAGLQALVHPPERPVTFSEVTRAVLDAALAAEARPVTLTVRPRRIDLLVRDHRVVVELSGGVLRVVWVGAPVGGGPATRDQRVALDDADEAAVGAMVSRAIEEGMAPF